MGKVYIGMVFILIFYCSCEKTINFKLDRSPSQLVVDATIENDRYPIVLLSQSLDYFSQINPELLSQSFVHQATVFVSNGDSTQQLNEYAQPAGSGNTFIYYYTVDSANLSHAFTGSLHRSYKLLIKVNGQSYSAGTTVPPLLKKIDSVWWKPAPHNPDSGKVVVMAKITDPPGYGDYVRYFTKENNEGFYPGLNSVFDDQIVDGTTYEIPVDKGVNRNLPIDLSNSSFFQRGDTVVVKFCDIDKAVFDFWRTMEFNYQSIGNPFSSPTRVQGNISNNALGYFGGYAAQYLSLKIPK